MRTQHIFAIALSFVVLIDARRGAPVAVPKRVFGLHNNPYCFGLDNIAKKEEEKLVKEVKAVKKPEEYTKGHEILDRVEAAMAGLE